MISRQETATTLNLNRRRDRAPDDDYARSLDIEVSEAISEIQRRQNVGGAFASGAVLACLFAIVWAAITAVFETQPTYLAVGAGVLLGLAVKRFGRGVTPLFGAIGAGLVILAIALANLLGGAALVAAQWNENYLRNPAQFDPRVVVDAVAADIETGPVVVLVYILSVYLGYRFSFAPININQLRRDLATKNPPPAQPYASETLKLRFRPPQGWLAIPSEPTRGTLGIYRSPRVEGAATAIMVLMNYYLKHGQSFESFVEQTADELLAKPTGVEILGIAPHTWQPGTAVKIVYHATQDDPPYMAQMHIFNRGNRIAAVQGRVDRHAYAKFAPIFDSAADTLRMDD